MSNPTTNDESEPITQVALNKSMTYEDMRKIYPNLPESLPVPTRSVECNMMSYIDDKGVRKEIWMPKGTADTASKHLKKKNWDALAKFPEWSESTFKYTES
jgi:hypothetical protein